jgi:hypothetical protein
MTCPTIGSELMRDLWAVDDSDELKKLEDAARRKDSFGFRARGAVRILVIGTVVNVIVRSITTGWRTDVMAGAVVGVTVYVWGRWIRRRIRKHLPEVLLENGRCCTCGYDLRGVHESRCPECGTIAAPLEVAEETEPSKSDEV